MMETKLVLLGTGTPNACPNASGPSTAVVVGDRSYLVDFGPGVVRQAAKAYQKGIDALRPDRLTVAFCTHLHTDHTAGYADLIFTPWVLERKEPLRVFGPKGIREMTDHIEKAYAVDIDFRINGFEKANEEGYKVEAKEIQPGIIYQDDRVTVEAFPVSHGTLESYGFKFTTPDKVIVISGDTAPLEENQVRIRFRVDGALRRAMRHDISLHAALIARIKIVSGLDISEKRRPQDGRATSIVDRQEYDIRVSVLPTVYGEKVVMRLAQKKALTLDKRDLGFPEDELKKFDHILSHPNGLILVMVQFTRKR